MAAESEVEAAHKLMEDPKVLADRDKLADACARMDKAQKLVQTLYVRWQALEEKQG